MSVNEIPADPKPIYRSPQFEVWPDRVQQGSWTAHAISRDELVSNYPMTDDVRAQERRWTRTKDLSVYPQLSSDFPLLDSLYRLSLEELRADLETDGTLSAGAMWPGVWTRDVSYSVLLSLALVMPEAAKASLRARVSHRRIVQDPGTGGSWPVSSDRMVWAVAAWEVWKVTGDEAWLQEAYAATRDSMLDDEATVLDPATGLFRGETSFLDWREQTYPRWMQPADIFESASLSTNALHLAAYRLLAKMAARLPGEQQDASAWAHKGDALERSMQRAFRHPDGSLGIFRYGRDYPLLAPATDGLGSALAVLFGFGSEPDRKALVRNMPRLPFGTPTVHPQQPEIMPYHNESVWPFVEALHTWAAAQVQDASAVLLGVASLTRASALFLTNKENMVLASGSSHGTAVNSDRQLWSVAGNLALTYRVLFGMNFAEDGVTFAPVVPKPLGGVRRLTGLRYRGMVLDIEVRGFGTVRRFFLDGVEQEPFLSADLKGAHKVVVELTNVQEAEPARPFATHAVAPATPRVIARSEPSVLQWMPAAGAVRYRVLRNGTRLQEQTETTYVPKGVNADGQFQVIAMDVHEVESFASEPVDVGASMLTVPLSQTEPYMELTQASGSQDVQVNVAESGNYGIQLAYSNGAGPVNTGNRCAIRSLFVDGRRAGSIVMPQRGTETWESYGLSSRVRVVLAAGPHTVSIQMEPTDRNMNEQENRARVQRVALTRREQV